MSESFDATRNAQVAQRRNAQSARSQLTADDRMVAAEKIASTVAHSSWFARAEFIGCYLPANSEASTWPIISRAWRRKKRIFAPVAKKKGRMQFCEVTAESMLLPNRFGLLEPVDGDILPARQLQIVLTPLVAFDTELNRIGMGGGYYDRAFAFLKNRKSLIQPKLIGIAYDCQRVEKIVTNPWDIRLYRVITESS